MNLDRIQQAGRLEELGLVIRSAELLAQARELQEFHAKGGNRAMRRAAQRASRKSGRR